MIRDLKVSAHTARCPGRGAPDVPSTTSWSCELTLDDGRTGTGFSWTPQIGAQAVQGAAGARHPRGRHRPGPAPRGRVGPALAAPARGGPGGITTVALAGVDLALWDLRCGERGLADVLGRGAGTVPVYGSGVNLHYSLEELVAQAGAVDGRGLSRGQDEGRPARPRRGRRAGGRGPRGHRSRTRC